VVKSTAYDVQRTSRHKWKDIKHFSIAKLFPQDAHHYFGLFIEDFEEIFQNSEVKCGRE
jgi:hypothetical protein